MFFKGIIIGFAVAAPLGPIGLLCIQRTLTGGIFHGLISGLGAAAADAIYSIIAAFGVAFISSFLLDQQFLFRLSGGLFLCFLGSKSFLSKPIATGSKNDVGKNIGAFSTTFFLTLTNPLTIIYFSGIFAGTGATGVNNSQYFSAILLVLGVFTGSCLWWIILCGFSNIFRYNLDYKKLGCTNKLAGVVLFIFGVFVLYSIL